MPGRGPCSDTHPCNPSQPPATSREALAETKDAARVQQASRGIDSRSTALRNLRISRHTVRPTSVGKPPPRVGLPVVVHQIQTNAQDSSSGTIGIPAVILIAGPECTDGHDRHQENQPAVQPGVDSPHPNSSRSFGSPPARVDALLLSLHLPPSPSCHHGGPSIIMNRGCTTTYRSATRYQTPIPVSSVSDIQTQRWSQQ